jgi:hypothetical protein
MPQIDRMLLADNDAILALLDRHHEAAATKNVEGLQEVFVPHGLFVGTDDTEKRTTNQLLDALERTKSGWDMTHCLQRHIYAVPGHPDVATFFEVVNHTKYGHLRGSGCVVREDGRWQIASYTLSFSVPNEVVDQTNILELLAQTA